MRKPIRRVAIKGVIALVAASLFAATASQHVLPLTKQRAYNVMQVAQIDEAPSTIGVADSELYAMGTLAEVNARLDLMQSLGVTNVRIMVPWAGVQPLHPDTPFGFGAPQWGQLDMVVNAAAARGMGILGVLNSTPVWATSTTPISGQPTNINRFADFAKSVALRYGDKISAYEVWNEPNSVQFWNPMDPAAYTEMLKVTYTALKQAAAEIGEEITVIGGVVGSVISFGNLTMNPIDFVRKMYEAGANGYFDALSFHPYNYDWKFSVGEDLPWKVGMPLYQLNEIREMMDSFLVEGQEQVKIWLTEYGLPTNKVSEATQAAFVRDLIEYWQTVSGAGPIFLYTIKDWLDAPANNDEANLGIFRPDGTMKPVGQVIKELIEFLTDPPTNPGTGPGEGPGAVTPPSNPIAAFLAAIQKAFTSVFSMVPNLFTAFSSIFSNFLNGIFGKKPSTAPVSAMSAAAADVDPDATEAGAVETVTDGDAKLDDSPGNGENSPGTDELVTVEKPVAEAVVAEELPAIVEAPAEEVVTEVPAEEVTEEEVAEEVPAGEVTESEDPTTEPEAEAPAATDDETTDTETVNDKVTDESQDAGDAGAPKKNSTTSRTGKRDALATESADTAGPDARESATPNLKARHEQGPRTAVRSGSESGQGSPTRQSAGAGSPSGGDR